jgi:hypothetical protein
MSQHIISCDAKGRPLFLKGYATASITAQNTFSDSVMLRGPFNVLITGTFSATVTLQRSFDNGSTWIDHPTTWTTPTWTTVTECEYGVLYRIGVKTGGFTSGTAVLRISQ